MANPFLEKREPAVPRYEVVDLRQRTWRRAPDEPGAVVCEPMPRFAGEDVLPNRIPRQNQGRSGGARRLCRRSRWSEPRVLSAT